MPPTADGVPDLAELLAQPSIGCRALETFYSPIGHTLSNSMVATVHCVTCLQTGQACCVKVTRKRAVLGALDLRALEREAVLHRQLEHPNIVRLLDAFETRDTFQVVMEYVPGRSLAGHLACCLFKRMDEGATRMLFRQLLRAVAHAHERNVVHCDINPNNVLLHMPKTASPPGRAVPRVLKLCDFGAAVPARDPRYLKATGSVSLVPFTRRLGTPGFIAPEFYLEVPFTSAVDMWSCGVLLFKMLAGYLPFPNHAAMLAGRIEFDTRRWPTLSAEARDMVCQLLQVDPARRLTARQALQHPWMLSEHW